MRFLWNLFNQDTGYIPRETTHTVVDNIGEWPVSKEYADTGLAEGWLEVFDSRIDQWEREHFKYRHV